MELPLRVLEMFNADFDGDAMTILHIINHAFFVRAYEIYNPRNAMQISRNDGKFNEQVCIKRDTLICVNSFVYLGRKYYDEEKMNKIEKIRQKWRWKQ